MANKVRLLMVGPLPPPVGGTTVFFRDLVAALCLDTRFEVRVVNISRGDSVHSRLQNIWAALKTLVLVTRWGFGTDVISFHASQRGRFLFGPIIFCLARLLGKPIIMRVFGGAFDQQYQAVSPLHQRLMRHTYFQADICLFETQHLTAYFRQLPIRRAEWFPHYTQAVEQGVAHAPLRTYCRKLVFIGRVTRTKGIDAILEAAPLLETGVTIDLFGPLYDGYTADAFQKGGAGRITYGGVLEHGELIERLKGYDALVLPTFHDGEGYPAVILEAFAQGLPVITTRWLSIPEIVDETCGILIEPRSAQAFADAVNRLCSDDTLYQRLQQGTYPRASQFSAAALTEKFARFCLAFRIPPV
jgi:glycosyltransferase involved in cell wall biosynthesis